MRTRLFAAILTLAIATAACASGGGGAADTGGRASSSDTGGPPSGTLVLDDYIADNGYADVTLGTTLDGLRETYEPGTFAETSYAPEGLSSYTVVGLPQLQLLFRDGVLWQADVTQPGLPSINGLHEVGDPISDVVERYEARIAAGERLSVTCAANSVMARARTAYRLVFFTDGEIITRISSLSSDHIVPGDPCAELGAPLVEEYIEPTQPDEPMTLERFVPNQLGGREIRIRNPNTDQLSGEYAFLWWTAAHRFSAVGVIGYADSIVSCLYRGTPPAFAVGVYTEPLRIVVAVAPGQIASLENLGCGAKEIIKDFLCPNCLILQPAGGAYVANVSGETFAVAYVTMGGPDDTKRMCELLPYCSGTTFTTVPPLHQS